MEQETKARPLQFSDCSLNPATRALIRAGEPVRVQNQVFDLLLYLARNPGRVITKDELLNAVWTHPFQTDAAIAQAVRKARRAVGDDGKRQAVIRTVQGQGLQFVAPVRELPPSSEASMTVSAAARPTRVRNLSRLALLVLGTVAAFALWRWPAPGGADPASIEPISIGIPIFELGEAITEEWLGLGLSETVARALADQPGWRVHGPATLTDIPEAEPPLRASLAGVDLLLDARVERTDTDLTLDWTLTPADPDDLPRTGRIRSIDAARLARELVDAVLTSRDGETPVFVPHRELLDDPLAAELYARGIQALHRQRNAEAIELLEAATTRLPDSGLLQAALAKARFDPNAFENSMIRYQRLLEQTPDAEPRARAWLLYEIGSERWFQGDVDQAALFLEQALSFSKRADDVFLHAMAANSLAFVRQSQNRFDEAWTLALEAEQEFRALGAMFHLGQALTNLGYLAEDFGRLLQARAFHEDALALREQSGLPELVAASHYGLARVDRRLGRFDEAAQRIERNLGEVARLQRPFDLFDNLEELAEIRMRQGRDEDAWRLLDRAESIALEQDDAIGQAWVEQVRARIDLRRGRAPPEAFGRIARSILGFDALGEVYQRFEARVELARLYQLAGRGGVAGVLLDSLADNPAKDNPVLRLAYAEARAEQALMNRDHDDAIERYEAIVSEARRLGAADVEAEAALRLGAISLEVGQRDRAERMLLIARRWSPDYERTHALAAKLGAD